MKASVELSHEFILGIATNNTITQSVSLQITRNDNDYALLFIDKDTFFDKRMICF